MADEVGRHGQQRDHHALVGDVAAHAAGEDSRPGLAGLALHDVALGLLHAEGQGWEAVGDQVDPQQMHRLQDGKAHEGGKEDGEHLAHVGGQQELDGLADVVIDPAALLHGAHDGGKVVVRQHHVRHVLGDVRAGDAHAHADVGALDGGGVVDAVAGHGGDEARLAPGVYDAGLVLGLYARVDADVAEGLLKGLVIHGAQLAAGDGPLALPQDAKLACDGGGGVDVVAGDHHDADTGALALVDGGLDLRAHRVDHAGQADEAEVLLQILRLKVRRRRVIASLRRGQHAQGPGGHLLIRLQHGAAEALRHLGGGAVFQVMRAAGEHLVQAALGILHAAALALLHGRHHLAAAVKWRLADAGELRLQIVLVQAQLFAPGHQGGLGGLAGDGAVLVGLRVAAEGHGRGQEFFVLSEGVHHGHAVLGQGAGLVRADHLGAAQGLHGGEPADDGAAFGHVGDPDGEHDGHHRHQPLRDGGHGQGHGDHEGVEHHLCREFPGPEQAHREDHHADAQHQLRQDMAQLVQLHLQGGLALHGVFQGIGDLAHLGVHAGGGDHHGAAAIDHGGAHVGHVLPVAQRHVLLPPPQGDEVDELAHRDALAGEGRLLDLHGGAVKNAAVGGHRVPRLQNHHVAHDQILTLDRDDVALSQHLAGGGGHLLQGLDGLLGLVLLVHAQHRVDDDHEEDDEHIRKALAAVAGGQGADEGGRQQDQNHGVRHLGKELLDDRFLFGFLELVLPVCGQALFGLRRAQALGTAAGLGKDRLDRFTVVLHAFHPSFSGNKKRPLSPEYHIPR